MKFKNFLLLNEEDSAIAIAVKIEKPLRKQEYSKQYATKCINELIKGIRQLQKTFKEGSKTYNVIFDLFSNLRAWIELYEDRFDKDNNIIKRAKNVLSPGEPDITQAPLDPMGPMDPKLSLKVAGVEDENE